MLIFLFVYVVTNIGAFTGIIALADATGSENIRDFDGFGRRSPVDCRRDGVLSAGAGGHPADGWLPQQAVHLLRGLERGRSALTFLVILGLINSTISIVYYGNVVWRMYVDRAAEEGAHPVPGSVSLTMAVAVIGIFALTIALGLLLPEAASGAGSLIQVIGH